MSDATIALFQEPIEAAAKLTESGFFSAFKSAVEANTGAGFAAAGALLGMFVLIAKERSPDLGGLQALQLGLLAGAALFSSATCANAQAADWAKGLLDPVTMGQAAGAIDPRSVVGRRRKSVPDRGGGCDVSGRHGRGTARSCDSRPGFPLLRLAHQRPPGVVARLDGVHGPEALAVLTSATFCPKAAPIEPPRAPILGGSEHQLVGPES
jgi:hypothetical protein